MVVDMYLCGHQLPLPFPFLRAKTSLILGNGVPLGLVEVEVLGGLLGLELQKTSLMAIFGGVSCWLVFEVLGPEELLKLLGHKAFFMRFLESAIDGSQLAKQKEKRKSVYEKNEQGRKRTGVFIDKFEDSRLLICICNLGLLHSHFQSFQV